MKGGDPMDHFAVPLKNIEAVRVLDSWTPIVRGSFKMAKAGTATFEVNAVSEIDSGGSTRFRQVYPRIMAVGREYITMVQAVP